jgi:hypothetical protein
MRRRKNQKTTKQCEQEDYTIMILILLLLSQLLDTHDNDLVLLGY